MPKISYFFWVSRDYSRKTFAAHWTKTSVQVLFCFYL